MALRSRYELESLLESPSECPLGYGLALSFESLSQLVFQLELRSESPLGSPSECPLGYRLALSFESQCPLVFRLELRLGSPLGSPWESLFPLGYRLASECLLE